MPSAIKYFLFAAGAAVFFSAAARVDLELRFRNANREAESCAAMAADPALKARAVEEEFAPRLEALRESGRTGSLGGAELPDALAMLEAEKNFRAGEDPAKYAYIWRRTAAGLLSPSDPRRAKALAKAGEARALWKKKKAPGTAGR